MGTIFAIGGGEIGRGETKIIDKEIISQVQKKKPKLLFIPTATSDSIEYANIVTKYFSKLGCEVDVLYLIKKVLSKKQIENQILSADIIYVGGGNTLKMMIVWRKLGVDKILQKAYKKNIILTGISAGSICWFDYGNSDSRKFTSNSNQLIKVKGLGFVNALHCPHYDVEKHRQKDLKRMMKKTSKIIAIALENCCAIQIHDREYRIIKNKKSAKAYKIYWKRGNFYKKEIIAKKEFSNLDDLLTK